MNKSGGVNVEVRSGGHFVLGVGGGLKDGRVVPLYGYTLLIIYLPPSDDNKNPLQIKRFSLYIFEYGIQYVGRESV